MFLSLRATRRLALLAIGAFLVTETSAMGMPSLKTTLSRSSTVSEVFNTLPECSQSCFTAAVANTTCSTSDFSCVCESDASTLTAVWACGNACTINEELTTERVIKLACGDTIHNEASHIRSIFWTLYCIAFLSFGCRLLARSRKFGGIFWWDDWFIIASFTVLTAVSIGAEIMVIFGLGQDKWQLNDNQITIVLILFYIAEFAYVIESALTKTSIVVLYLRIFPSKTFRYMCWGLLAFLVCFAIVFLVTLLTYCVPFEYVWQMWDNRHVGKCINMTAQTYVCAALNIVLDVTIFLMPIPKLMKLETDWKTKMGVILTFMLGLFVTICSVVRLTFLAGWTESTNPTYDYANLALWSLIELNAGVICACLPGLASLFRRIKKDHQEKKRSTANASSYGNNSHASRANSKMFNGGGSSGLRSYGGKESIIKTTMVSVHYNARESDGLSDEVELMEHSQAVPSNLVEDARKDRRESSM